nr:reverse transcriptase domain-containing protein [Tanacetum cinerariifolium]
MPADCLKIIESKSKVRQTRAKAVVAKVSSNSSTPAVSADVAELKDMNTQHTFNRGNNFNQNRGGNFTNLTSIKANLTTPGKSTFSLSSSGLSSSSFSDSGVSQNDFERYIKANDAVLRNIQNQGQRTQNQCQSTQNHLQTVQNQLANLTDMTAKFMSANTALSSGSGTLPGNTVTNPKEDLKGITTRSGVAYQGPTTPTPSKVAKPGTEVIKDQVQTSNSQSTAPIQPTVTQSEPETPVSEPVVAPISAPMPNLKPEMARTPMNEHCSAVILNKLPKKFGDPRKFLIPCEFPRMDECLALADLGASINLMPLSTSHALIDVYKGELTLQIGNKAITYNLDQTSRYSANYDQKTANKIDVTDEACEEYSQEFLGFFDVTASGSPTPSDDPIVSTTSPTLTPFGDSDFLLFEEADAFLGLEDDPDSPELDPSYYDPEGDILSLEAILNSDPSPPLLNHEQSVPSFKEELKACEA